MKTRAGWIATALWLLASSLWSYWGTAEFFYEAWGLGDPRSLLYFVPALVFWGLGLLALARPRVGGALLLAVGLAFTLWWWGLAAARGLLTWSRALGTAPVSLMLGLVGALWWLEGRARGPGAATSAPVRWAAALPLAVAAAVSAVYLPYVLDRAPAPPDAWRVETPAGLLEWAPAGPGWNLRLGVRYPSWRELAQYGLEPRGLAAKPGPLDMDRYGLCAYLDPAGTRLADGRVGVWRLPTRAEVVASLVRGGEPAGCRYAPDAERAECARVPNK